MPLDPDMNNYDTQHVTMDHPQMSKSEWEGIYREVWDLYYTEEHVATVLRRSRAWGYDPKHMLAKLFAFHAPMVYERMHPLEGGLIRRKVGGTAAPASPSRTRWSSIRSSSWSTSPSMRAPSPCTGGTSASSRRWRPRPIPEDYMDTAMSPVEQGEEDNLQLFTATVSAQEFVKKRRALPQKRKKASA